MHHADLIIRGGTRVCLLQLKLLFLEVFVDLTVVATQVVCVVLFIVSHICK